MHVLLAWQQYRARWCVFVCCGHVCVLCECVRVVLFGGFGCVNGCCWLVVCCAWLVVCDPMRSNVGSPELVACSVVWLFGVLFVCVCVCVVAVVVGCCKCVLCGVCGCSCGWRGCVCSVVGVWRV